MRYAVAFAAVAAAFVFQSPASQAQGYPTAPWCSYVDTGMYNVTESCIYPTFAACRDQVLAGNRGFCNVNPYIETREPVRRSSRRVYQGR